MDVRAFLDQFRYVKSENNSCMTQDKPNFNSELTINSTHSQIHSQPQIDDKSNKMIRNFKDRKSFGIQSPNSKLNDRITANRLNNRYNFTKLRRQNKDKHSLLHSAQLQPELQPDIGPQPGLQPGNEIERKTSTLPGITQPIFLSEENLPNGNLSGKPRYQDNQDNKQDQRTRGQRNKIQKKKRNKTQDREVAREDSGGLLGPSPKNRLSSGDKGPMVRKLHLKSQPSITKFFKSETINHEN